MLLLEYVPRNIMNIATPRERNAPDSSITPRIGSESRPILEASVKIQMKLSASYTMKAWHALRL